MVASYDRAFFATLHNELVRRNEERAHEAVIHGGALEESPPAVDFALPQQIGF
jgi:hypothetical protein